jgi:hypothetical protein
MFWRVSRDAARHHLSFHEANIGYTRYDIESCGVAVKETLICVLVGRVV